MRNAAGLRKPVRIHVLFESQDQLTPNGSSYIRLLRPLGHPSLSGRVDLSYAAEMTDKDVDVVIIDRLWRDDLTPARQAALLRSLAGRGVPYLYSIDDNLLDLNVAPGGPQYPGSLQRNLVREFIRSAAGVIVSTDSLSERIGRLNANVAVVPNQLDETLFSEAHQYGRRPSAAASGPARSIVIGYMGTYSHLEDLMMIAHPLRRLLGRHPGRIRLEFVGVAAREQLMTLFPDAELEVLRVPASCVRYPEFVSWMQRSLRWDLALAPLRPGVFNRSKSDIKLLDYGMLGIPGLFSAAPAYERSVEHGITGLLVDDSSEEWDLALDRMVTSEELREKMSAAVRRHVLSSRTLVRHAVDWEDAIVNLLGSAAALPALPAPQWAEP